MPTPVHAVVVARSGSSAAAQLTRTLEALRAQTAAPAAVTVVVLGDSRHVRGIDGIGHTVEGIVEARAANSFADAIALAQPRIPDGRSVWLLAQDTVPERTVLRELAGALERSPSAAIAAPKLVRHDDDREIVSLGVSMSQFGRSVELAANELDQGQHDATEDALGADVRGLLIRGAAPKVLRPDPALAGADEGLDLGVRSRLGGARVVLVPSARVGVHRDGPAALPVGGVARAWATRRAQLHRRLTYAPALAVPVHWLSLLPLALWRSIVHLISKRPGEVAPEWGAALRAMVGLRSLARSRAALRSFRTASWASIAPLRVSRSQLRQRLDDGHGSERGAVSELNFFGGGGAWAVLAALVVGIAAFVPLLASQSISGGALLPLRDTLAALWQDATWGRRDLGLDVVGPADPFAAVIAALGTLWPGSPSYALVLLWLLALPLAVLGGWFAATRVTDKPGLRILGGALWALAPTFLTALVQGRPAAVLLHLLLPWVLHSAVVAHRSWGAAGAASLLTAAALACAPILAPAFVALWALTLILMLATRRLHGAARLVWLLIPSAVMFTPLIIWQLRHGDPWALLADPGVIRMLPQATADAAGRTAVAEGFPTIDRGGWEWLVGTEVAQWMPLLLAPLVLLALLAALSPRWRAGMALLLIAMLGMATALFSVDVIVSFSYENTVAIWPGTGLSLAGIGVIGAALVTLDTVVARAALRGTAALIAGVAVAACAVPALIAVNVGETEVRSGSTSTLPALVAAQAKGDRIGTLVMTPRNDGSLSVELVWGSSATLGAQTTMLSTSTRVQSDELATDAVDLLSARDFDAAGALAARGIAFVLLGETPAERDRARAMRTDAITSIDQRAGFVKAGDTPRGTLWRVDVPIAQRTALSQSQQSIGHLVGLVQLIIVLSAVLLAIPTRASRRAARARSRVVGRASEEPLVLPTRKNHDHPPQTAPETTAPEKTAPETTDSEPTGSAATAPEETSPDESAAGAEATPTDDGEDDR